MPQMGYSRIRGNNHILHTLKQPLPRGSISTQLHLELDPEATQPGSLLRPMAGIYGIDVDTDRYTNEYAGVQAQ